MTEPPKKPLVAPEDIAKVTHLDQLGMQGLARVVMAVMQLDDLNQLYERIGQHQGLEFIDALFQEIEVEFDFYEEELKRIPKEGPFITISNHPLGGIDGLLLLRLVSKVRPDFKVMANFLLQKVEPIKDLFMAVNPFEDAKEVKSSFAGIKESLEHLKAGHGLGIFPAGEVSTYHFEDNKISDREWQEGAMKLIQKAQVPVVPIYFKARNSRLFYLLSMLSPTLRTAKLPSELLHPNDRTIRIRVGRAISVAEQARFNSLEAYSHMLRQRTYVLANTLEPERIPKPFANRKKDPEPIAEPKAQEVLKQEIAQLEAHGGLLTIHREFKVFLAKAYQIPELLQEIGRLREITFREVGEGTNRPYDLDPFDYHYRHLLLWDHEAGKLAGAYRLGLGKEIYEQFGIKGFYVRSLFKIKKSVHPIFSQCIEMGRAFILKEYQMKPMPLFLLWKGIMHVMLRYPEHNYLAGCVSISGKFSRYSKSLMIQFLEKHYLDKSLAKKIKAKKPFRLRISEEEAREMESITQDDLNKVDRYIEEIEPGNMRFPILLKKYIKQNARLVAFNVDPDFNYCVDGFMYIRTEDIPEDTVGPVRQELEEKGLLQRKG